MARPKKSSNRLEKAIRSVLPPSAHVETIRVEDDQVLLVIGTQEIKASWADSGWLKQVRKAIGRKPKPDIVIARKISPGSKEELKKNNIGWVDETGDASIAIGSIIVSKSGIPINEIQSEASWTKSTLAVAETILCTKETRVEEIQRLTGLSRGSCTKALQTLTGMQLLTASTKRGPQSTRSVRDTEQLLTAYADAATLLSPKEKISLGVTWKDPTSGLQKIGEKWDRKGIEWFATGAVAASVLVLASAI
ncbi:MAG: hypothetical protein R3B45_09545 [Bdellovibrionota bacterium]